MHGSLSLSGLRTQRPYFCSSSYMARAKPYCEDCVQDENLTAGPQGLCQQVYDEMNRCMKTHKGNVADCVPEWNAFRNCYQISKQKVNTEERKLSVKLSAPDNKDHSADQRRREAFGKR